MNTVSFFHYLLILIILNSLFIDSLHFPSVFTYEFIQLFFVLWIVATWAISNFVLINFTKKNLFINRPCLKLKRLLTARHVFDMQSWYCGITLRLSFTSPTPKIPKFATKVLKRWIITNWRHNSTLQKRCHKKSHKKVRMKISN